MTSPESGRDDGAELAARQFTDATEVRIADIERALTLLDEGRYGTCEVCGAPIGDELLAARPSGRRCARHDGDATSLPTEDNSSAAIGGWS